MGGNGSHSSGSGTGFPPSFFVGLGREEIKVCGIGTGEVWEFTPVSPSNTHPAYTLWRKIRSFIVKETDTWQHTHIKPPLVDSQHRTAALSFTSSHRKHKRKQKQTIKNMANHMHRFEYIKHCLKATLSVLYSHHTTCASVSRGGSTLHFYSNISAYSNARITEV